MKADVGQQRMVKHATGRSNDCMDEAAFWAYSGESGKQCARVACTGPQPGDARGVQLYTRSLPDADFAFHDNSEREPGGKHLAFDGNVDEAGGRVWRGGGESEGGQGCQAGGRSC